MIFEKMVMVQEPFRKGKLGYFAGTTKRKRRHIASACAIS